MRNKIAIKDLSLKNKMDFSGLNNSLGLDDCILQKRFFEQQLNFELGMLKRYTFFSMPKVAELSKFKLKPQ
jgi:hypothetical protein